MEERTRELRDQEQIRTNLMTNIFHDLRSPLLIMQGCMEHLNRGENDPKYLEVLTGRLSFITKLTEDLFNVVKLEDNTMLMETEPVPIKPLLEQTITGCMPML